MKTLRLVVAGTPGAGKSTFVRTISDIEVVDTDRSATDQTALLKPKTTVAFDYGRFVFGSTVEVQIYGTPGQSRFNFMWDFLIQRAHTYILLVAAHRPNDFHYARQILLFMNQRVQIPMLIGITHSDCPGACSANEIMSRLGFMNDKNRPPVLQINPTERGSVAEAVMASMALLVAQYNIPQSTNKGEASPSTQPKAKSPYQFPLPNFSRGR
ncbi:GTP-binding protein [Allocoleopsis sp.]|uniref:GTP-binding protein n=1 Tax=Allocoleopsis sp. TaxID=3088169 RepID=UPI002FD39FD5